MSIPPFPLQPGYRRLGSGVVEQEISPLELLRTRLLAGAEQEPQSLGSASASALSPRITDLTALPRPVPPARPGRADLASRLRSIRPTTRRALNFSDIDDEPGANFDSLSNATRATRLIDLLAVGSRVAAASPPPICLEKDFLFHQPLLELMQQSLANKETLPPSAIGAKVAARWRRDLVVHYGSHWASKHIEGLSADDPSVQLAVQAWLDEDLVLARDPKEYDNPAVLRALNYLLQQVSAQDKLEAIEQVFLAPSRPLSAGGAGELESLIQRLQSAFSGLAADRQRQVFGELLERLTPIIQADPECVMSGQELRAFSDLHEVLLDFVRNSQAAEWKAHIKTLTEDLDRRLGFDFGVSWGTPRAAAEQRLLLWATEQNSFPYLASDLTQVLHQSQGGPGHIAAQQAHAIIAEAAASLCNEPFVMETLGSLRVSEEPETLERWSLELQAQLLQELRRWPEHRAAWKMRQIRDLMHAPSADGTRLSLTPYGAHVWLVLLKLASWEVRDGMIPALCRLIGQVSDQVMTKLLQPLLVRLEANCT